MFLYRAFTRSQQQQQHQTASNNGANATTTRVVDLNERASFTPSASSNTKEPVLVAATHNEVDDFTDVQFRPLTYAEVATIASPDGVEPNKIHIPLEDDYAVDDNDDYYSSSIYDDNELEITNKTTRQPSVGEISEFEYGDRAATVAFNKRVVIGRNHRDSKHVGGKQYQPKNRQFVPMVHYSA